MATNQRTDIDPQDVRSHAHGERFLIFLIAPWVIGVLGGVVLSLALGIGLAIGIGSGLAIALGCNFVWIVIVFAIDDGEVDLRAQEAGEHEDHPPRVPAGRSEGGTTR